MNSKVIVLGIVVIAMSALLLRTWNNSRGGMDIDRSSHASVGRYFVMKNGVIARKIGKVNRTSHIGNGGGGGKVSYNVFRLYGEKENAVCDLTIKKDDENRWYVDSAMLTLKGMEYKITVKRSEGGKISPIF